LSLVYQPQLDDKYNLIGAEALLRWNSKKLGYVSPDEFMSLAEQSGLTMVNMSKNLNVEVIAEGVETLAEKEALIVLGCHQFQGYYFSKPIDAGQFQSIYLKTSTL
jgi:EAL domain-containing protein (putative c-di-GMP-specific phosphodiesterase class I)